jgi:serine/threonine protein phosphatase 1
VWYYEFKETRRCEMKKFAVSDIHGANRALVQVLERCGFDNDVDQLIFIGDVCDGWREVKECIHTLAGIKNLVQILGNHDDWALRWLKGSDMSMSEQICWMDQGGQATIDSIGDDKEFCLEFLSKFKGHHIDGHKLFVHGGIPPESKVEDNSLEELIWNRTMVGDARYALFSGDKVVEHYDEVFVGHTPTLNCGSTTPCNFSNVWMIDTGGSYDGKLSIIDVDTKEFWQSDKVVDLYPGESAR